MPRQRVTLDLPETLYGRLKRRADHSRRSVEAELLELLVSAMPEYDELSDDPADALAALAFLSKEELEHAGRSHFPEESSAQLEALHWKQQREGLTEAERQAEAALIHRYERAMLVRAQAAALLKQRGRDVAPRSIAG